MKETTLIVDGKRVLVALYPPLAKVKHQAVLLLHGWNAQPDERVAIQLSRQDYTCVTVSFRGHHGSEGEIRSITAENSLDDAVAAYDFLKDHIPAKTKIIVVGSSYGSYIGVLLSNRRQVDAVSLRAPANYPDERFYDPKWGDGSDSPMTTAWRERVTNASDNMALRAISEFQGNIQVIESGADEQVPHQTIQNYVDAVSDWSRLEYHVMPGWSHSIRRDVAKSNEYVAMLQKWLDKLST